MTYTGKKRKGTETRQITKKKERLSFKNSNSHLPYPETEVASWPEGLPGEKAYDLGFPEKYILFTVRV